MTYTSLGGHVANAIRPSLFVTRSISFIATSGCGANIRPKFDSAKSKISASKGRFTALPSFYSMYFASARGTSPLQWLKARVGNFPVNLTLPHDSLLAVIDVLPVPHVTSG